MPKDSSQLIGKSNKSGSIPWKIYLSRALSAWGDRMWSFAGGVFITKFNEDNLRLVAIYGLVTCVSVILFGAAVGNWIDKHQRLLAAKVFLAIQNISVVVCCALLAVFFSMRDQFDSTGTIIVAVVVIIVNGVSYVASVGSKIVVEKDWIVVIASENRDRLATINSVFRTIDLVCFTLAPVIAGFLFEAGEQFAAIFVATWNIVSVCVEYFLLIMIYKEYPDLARKSYLENMEKAKEENGDEPSEDQKKPSKSIGARLMTTVNGWKMYFIHPVRNAGLGLAFLYMTVLGFDNITYGYCLSQCITESLLGGLVAASSVFGIMGSFSFPFIRKCTNVTKTGMIGMIALVGVLSSCVVSLWLPGSPFELRHDDNATVNFTTPDPDLEEDDCYVSSYWSIGALLFGIVTARFGLWIADLSITQILQEGVEEQFRGTINGVQGGLNSFMDTIKFILVIILPDEETFGYLVLASFGAICVGAISYLFYAVKNWRDDLLVDNKEEKDSSNVEENPNYSSISVE